MCHAELWAQGQPGVAYQQMVDAVGGGRGGRGVAMPLPRSETGKPFSATVTTQTTQTLVDGTHVNQTTTMMEYRDAEGRVRTETSQPGVSSSGQTRIITIRDPVAGVTYRLDSANKSAVRIAGPGGGAGGGLRGGTAATPEAMLERQLTLLQTAREQQTAGARGGRRGGGDNAPRPTMQPTQDMVVTLEKLQQQLEETRQATRNNPNDLVEDLGTLTVNGVAAHGTRITTVVPVGAIGNDREFRSVSERWFSSDLNLLIKSVNTDPRFGTTTYELTNISRQPPDASLFQVPADYTLIPNGVR